MPKLSGYTSVRRGPRRLGVQDWAQGLVQLARGAFLGITDAVEGVHTVVLSTLRRAHLVQGNVAGAIGARTRATYADARELGDAAFVFADQAVGLGAALLPLKGLDLGRSQLALRAALNGAFGDRMAAAGNPLAFAMSLRRLDGGEVTLTRTGIGAALGGQHGGKPSRRLVVLIHGLCMNDQQWRRPNGADFGSRLVADHGYSALYLRYNSGLHISENGRELACLLEQLLRFYPLRLERLVLIGHSMGGLVARSAAHYGTLAGYRWVAKLDGLAFLGSPHLGAPLERQGSAATHALTVTPFTAPFANLGNVRSAGVKDLRYGFLVDEDWRGRDPDHPERVVPKALAPLPGVRSYYAAASLGRRHGDFADRFFGDLLVPIKSATSSTRKPSRRLKPGAGNDGRIFFGMNHFEIMHHPQVYAAVAQWLHGGPQTPDKPKRRLLNVRSRTTF